MSLQDLLDLIATLSREQQEAVAAQKSRNTRFILPRGVGRICRQASRPPPPIGSVSTARIASSAEVI